MTQPIRTLAFLAASLLLLLAACGDPVAGTGTSSFTLELTDAPATEASAIVVDFGRIDLVPADAADHDGDDAGGLVTVSEDGGVIDNLLDYQNGATTTLVEDLDIPDGRYTQLRLIVESVSIVFGEGSDAVSYPVRVPSGPQSGLKINIEPDLLAEAGATSRITLDFDAANAVIETPPGSGNYLLKPTGIRAVTESGAVEGVVTGGGEPLVGARVEVYDGEDASAATPLVSAVTDEDGAFRIVTLLEGSYALEVVAEGYQTQAIEDVEIVVDDPTDLGEIELTPTAE